jgi:hypothetical protein
MLLASQDNEKQQNENATVSLFNATAGLHAPAF